MQAQCENPGNPIQFEFLFKGSEFGHWKVRGGYNAFAFRHPSLAQMDVYQLLESEAHHHKISPVGTGTHRSNLAEAMIRLLDDSSNEGLHLLNQTLRNSEHVLGRVWTEKLSPAGQRRPPSSPPSPSRPQLTLPHSTSKRAGAAPDKGRCHAPRRQYHQFLSIPHPPRLDATTCRNPPTLPEKFKRSLTSTQPVLATSMLGGLCYPPVHELVR